MKRLIVRRQVIDCNRETCGKCARRYGWHCNEFSRGLAEHRKTGKPARLYQCKNAEVREK